MQEMTLICSCCGAVLMMPAGAPMLACPACGTVNARPLSTGSTLESLTRAVRQRTARDFHEAEISYQQVLLQTPDEHEALWGRLLCRYGVEYVEDPSTRRLLPTVHSVQRKPMQEQADFRYACEYAPPEIAARYRREAAYIDQAQAEIRRLAETCPPYDVFLCHKTTKPGSGEKTDDFHRAYQLYHYLRDQGVRAFFAPECMTDVAGADYEAGIYNALETAKVMLVVCSDASYLTSPWVRSEWTRFLALADERGDKRLIPLLYDHFAPARLPQQFRVRRLQGVDMGDLNARDMVLNAVCRLLGRTAQATMTPQPEPVPAVPEAASEQPATPAAAPETPTAPAALPEQPATSAVSAAPPTVHQPTFDGVTLHLPGFGPEWCSKLGCIIRSGNGGELNCGWEGTVSLPMTETGMCTIFHERDGERIDRVVSFIGTFLSLPACFLLIRMVLHIVNQCWTWPDLLWLLGAFGVAGAILALIRFLMGGTLDVEQDDQALRPRRLCRFCAVPGGHYQLSWHRRRYGYRLDVKAILPELPPAEAGIMHVCAIQPSLQKAPRPHVLEFVDTSAIIPVAWGRVMRVSVQTGAEYIRFNAADHKQAETRFNILFSIIAGICGLPMLNFLIVLIWHICTDAFVMADVWFLLGSAALAMLIAAPMGWCMLRRADGYPMCTGKAGTHYVFYQANGMWYETSKWELPDNGE